MKILLVTNQIIEDTGNDYRCITNFYDIIKRFCYLGELYLCTQKYNGNNSHNKIDKSLTGLVKYGNVKFIKKDHIFMSSKNKSIIESFVKDVDLIISYGSSFDLLRIAKTFNKKYMSFVVSCSWDAYWNHGFLGKLIAPYQFFRDKYTIKHSDYVLYVTNQFLQKRYPTQAKYQIGCSNVRIPFMQESTLVNRLDFLRKWDGITLNIATTAAIDVPYKGQQYVIEAIYQLKKKGISNIHYYLLGGGNQNYLKYFVKKYDLDERIHFMGIVPHENVFTVLDRMHVYIQPSLQEGLPRSMVEAMSRGLLCIGANTAAIPELIQSNYVTKRKSASEISALLETINKKSLIEQAQINFKEAQKYQEEIINERRNIFFDKVIKDIESKRDEL